MDIGISRFLLIIDETIGNEFVKNEELSSLLLRMFRHIKKTEIITIKNTQVCSNRDILREFFTVKPFPRASIKKAIRLSTGVIYLTDGKTRERGNSLYNRVNRLKNKLVIIIKQ